MEYLIKDKTTNKVMKINISAKKLLFLKSLHVLAYMLYGIVISIFVSIPVTSGIISQDIAFACIVIAFIPVLVIGIVNLFRNKYMSPVDFIYEWLAMPVIKSMFVDKYDAEDLDQTVRRELFKLFTGTDTISEAYNKDLENHIKGKVSNIYNKIESVFMNYIDDR